MPFENKPLLNYSEGYSCELVEHYQPGIWFVSVFDADLVVGLTLVDGIEDLVLSNSLDYFITAR